MSFRSACGIHWELVSLLTPALENQVFPIFLCHMDLLLLCTAILNIKPGSHGDLTFWIGGMCWTVQHFSKHLTMNKTNHSHTDNLASRVKTVLEPSVGCYSLLRHLYLHLKHRLPFLFWDKVSLCRPDLPGNQNSTCLFLSKCEE